MESKAGVAVAHGMHLGSERQSIANVPGVSGILFWASTVSAFRIAEEEPGVATAVSIPALLSGLRRVSYTTFLARGRR